MALVLAISALLATVLPNGQPHQMPCPEGPEITLAAAPRCVGETRTVVGRIDHVARSPRGVLFVNFCADFRHCPFTAIVFREQVPIFADLARRAGSEVAITGLIGAYRGSPQIVLERAEQLVARTPAAVPTPVFVAPRRLRAPADPFAASSDANAPSLPEPSPPPREPAPDEPRTVGIFEASAHVGESVRVRGRVERLSRDGADLLVVLSRAGREAPFVGVVLEPNVEDLEGRARAWVGQDVVIAGDVTLFNGRAAIFVHDAAQVTTPSPARAER